ncbi:preprotein translocase subunit SecA [Natronocella acetinitrilica]|nr:preprotein translocase subunit SecA [Natronocella acetinitrilica]
MLGAIARKVFGSRNERTIRRMRKDVERINALEEGLMALSDADLAARTQEFKDRLAQGETLDSVLPEAFATVREASRRVLKMRHFDVQLIGGMVLNQGRIAEMKTGEGKTLVATLAVYLNALEGKGVHVVTVNDYLARRDAEWMGKIYQFLGMTTGVVVAGMTHEDKQAAYQADITYGTNNEYGFDYLRDNMALRAEDRVQRDLHFAIVDEVDSILIDEARTPLIISGAAEASSQHYTTINQLVPRLVRQQEEEGDGDFWIEEKSRQAYLTESGHEKVEQMFSEAGLLEEGESLYDASNIALMHQFNAALRAHHLFRRNDHYIVRDDQVIIVDEFTGRAMPGRRWSDGLHQAVEAKEGLEPRPENQTVASITFQNYFRLYGKLAGMTGTADTEAYEFQHIYGLEVVAIPTHRPMVREDHHDLVYLNQKDKFAAIVDDIKQERERGRPILVGTASIEVSELVAKRLEEENVAHEVLNAKQHDREAVIIAQAGQPGAVTIATNMAGRGTDIVLGGNVDVEIAALENPDDAAVEQLRKDWEQRHQKVVEAGGLYVIGTERHESRRIDNQLRGRSGRQGDPGATRFYLSLEDSLLRIFASDRVSNMMQRLGMEEGEAIESGLVSRVIENAQRKVEAHNFDIRKQLLEFDDVANDQRRVIYSQRKELLEAEEVSETINAWRHEGILGLVAQYVPPGSIEEQWNVEGLTEALDKDFALELPLQQWLDDNDDMDEEGLHDRILEEADKVYAEKEDKIGSETMRRLEKEMMLRYLDQHWKEHLAAMDYLRQGIHLRGYAQRNPKQEFKKEAFQMFTNLLATVQRSVAQAVHRVRLLSAEEMEALERQRRQMQEAMQARHESASALAEDEQQAAAGSGREAAAAGGGAGTYVRDGRKVGRNEPCPCGSGKKYKQCHGKL